MGDVCDGLFGSRLLGASSKIRTNGTRQGTTRDTRRGMIRTDIRRSPHRTPHTLNTGTIRVTGTTRSRYVSLFPGLPLVLRWCGEPPSM